MRLFPGCFHTWNLDCESVFTFFQQYGWFLVFMAECGEVPCWNVSRSDDRLWTPLFGCSVWPDGLHGDDGMLQRRDLRLHGREEWLLLLGLWGCCRAGEEFAPHPTTGDGRGEGAIETAFLVVLVHCWGAAGAFVEGFSKMVLASSSGTGSRVANLRLQRASVSSVRLDSARQRHRQLRLRLFGFHALHETSAATACKCVFWEIKKHAAAASQLRCTFSVSRFSWGICSNSVQV